MGTGGDSSTHPPNQGIANRILSLWGNSGASAELIDLMRLGIGLEPEHLSAGKSLSRWAELPGLCCQAAGGDPHTADHLAAAWLLFYSAAHLMDKVQDQDEPDPWWKQRGPGVALTAATGLFFSASLALNQIGQNPLLSQAALDINDHINRNLLVMASGQYSELKGPPQTLEQYWQRAEAKSGGFFSLACRNGARLATSDVDQLQDFSVLGLKIGLLVQVSDDLDDILPLPGGTEAGQSKGLAYSLPGVYALSVSSAEVQQQLKMLFDSAVTDPGSAKEVLSIINQSGATTYVLIELNRLLNQAHRLIDQVAKVDFVHECLKDLVNQFAIPRL